MTNKKEPASMSLSKLILTVSIIVSLGILFSVVDIEKVLRDERCSWEAGMGDLCAEVAYEFNSREEKCSIVKELGCLDKIPFSTLEECQNICEKRMGIKSAIVGKGFLITLPADPSTGYSWEANFDENYLILRSKDFNKIHPHSVSTDGTEAFTFVPIKAGKTTITMNYSKPWRIKRKTKVFEYNIKEKTVQNQDMSVIFNKTEFLKGEIINGF